MTTPAAAGRHPWRVALVATAVVGGLLAASARPAAADADPRRWVVTYRGAAPAAAAADRARARAISRRSAVAHLTAAGAAALRARPDVLAVEPDAKVRAAVTPNDTCLHVTCHAQPVSAGGPSQWWPGRVGMAAAWTASKGAGVTIAVLDSPIETSHGELAGKVAAPSYNATDFPADTQPHPHGTLVAGIAAAQTDNVAGIAGAGWSASILPIQVLASTCHVQSTSGRPPGTPCGSWPDDIASGEGLLSWIVRGIDRAVSSPARILNLSLTSDGASTALQVALGAANAAGKIPVAAAGNFTDGSDRTAPRFPAAFLSVISVAATDRSDNLASFSARGPYVDVAAPGVEIPGPALGGGLTAANGTSFSAPIVSGVVALLLAREPALRIDDIRARLVETGRARPDPWQTPLVSAGAALTTVDPYGLFAGGAYVARGALSSGGGVITGAGAGGGPHVRVFDLTGRAAGGGFFAYDGAFRGGVRVAFAGNRVVTAPGPGGGPNVRTFAGAAGGLTSSFFAYDPGYTGGVRVAGGRAVAGSGSDQIVTTPGPGIGPDVHVYDLDGTLLRRFFAYNPAFLGGITVTVCRQADATTRIVTGAGPGGGPHVNVLTDLGASSGGFFAFDPAFHGGVTVACGDVVAGNPGDEIVVGPGPGGGPNLRVFALDGRLLSSTFAFYSPLTGGLEVAADATGMNAALTRLANGVRFLPEPA